MGTCNVELTFITMTGGRRAGFAGRNMSTGLLIVDLSKQAPVPSCTSALGLSQSSVTVLLDVILRHCSSVVRHPTLKPVLALAALLSNLDT